MSWVSRTYQIPDRSREYTEMNAKTPIIGPDPQGFNELCQTLANLDPDEIYAAGVKEGRRRERRETNKWLRKTYPAGVNIICADDLWQRLKERGYASRKREEVLK